MPQTMSYNGNSVIFFRGDASKKIYILQSGRVILKREDIETNQEVQEAIQTGEFFGVKSALGKYDRDEDAIVVSDAQVVMFTVEEFEQLVSQNTRIGIKMLKVFSTQLRRVHVKVQSLLAVEDRNPEDGLFSSAEFYLKKKRYVESIHILRRYMKLYPQGRYISQANKYLKLAEEYLNKYGVNNGPAIISDNKARPERQVIPGPVADTTDEEKVYYNALTIASQGKFREAQEQFQNLLDSTRNSDIKNKANLEIGRCLFGQKLYDQCVKFYGLVIKASADHPDIGDIMFLVGQSYEYLNDKTKAASVYERVLQLGERVSDDVRKKVKAAQKTLGVA